MANINYPNQNEQKPARHISIIDALRGLERQQHQKDIEEKTQKIKTIEDFCAGYMNERCHKNCEREDEYCCIKCFKEKYIKNL